jgi:hypothetical protein
MGGMRVLFVAAVLSIVGCDAASSVDAGGDDAGVPTAAEACSYSGCAESEIGACFDRYGDEECPLVCADTWCTPRTPTGGGDCDEVELQACYAGCAECQCYAECSGG